FCNARVNLDRVGGPEDVRPLRRLEGGYPPKATKTTSERNHTWILAHYRRRIVRFNATEHPTAGRSDSQLQQLSMNPGGTPERVGGRHLADQMPHFATHPGAAGPPAPGKP